MNEVPEVPPPPPEIPNYKLWASLVIPPVATLMGTLVAAIGHSPSGYGIEFLFVLPFGLLTILVSLVFFVQAWRVRYRGRSLVLTSFGYVLGQIILCLCLWFGCCLAVIR